MNQWISNPFGIYSYFRAGRSTGSVRDPLREAVSFVESLELTGKEVEVGFVGIGSAAHLFEIRKRFPNLRLRIFDIEATDFSTAPAQIKQAWTQLCDSSVEISILSSEIKNGDLSDFHRNLIVRGPLFCFRPACDSERLNLFERLKGQEQEFFVEQCKSLQFRKLAEQVQLQSKDWAINIKVLDVSESQAGSKPQSDRDMKLLKTLRELVR